MEGVLSYYVFYLENHNGKTDPFLMDKILYNYLIIYYVNQESYIYYIPLCFYILLPLAHLLTTTQKKTTKKGTVTFMLTP